MRLPDYHIHTCYSPDSSMKQSEAVEAAIRAGITDMCFTEHMDLGHHLESFNRVPKFGEMYTNICLLREKYPDIQIQYGLEAGYLPETASLTAEMIETQTFDYVLLSTHCVDGLDCYLPESKRGRDKYTAYRRYLETLCESVTDSVLIRHYDCIGHIGYIAKCNYYENNTFAYEMFPKLFDEILKAIIRNEKGIEINTSGLKKAGHVLPHPSIIQRYYELGGRIITIGSDAHTAERIGENVAKAIEIVRKCGFKEVAVFQQRNAEWIKIV